MNKQLRKYWFYPIIGAAIDLSLTTTTISCSQNLQISNDLSNPQGGKLINQANKNSGLVVSAYANLLNAINPRTNLVFYPWSNKMTKYGFDLKQMQLNLNQVAPGFKIKINEDPQIQIKDGQSQLSLLIYDPQIQSWQNATISGFQSQISQATIAKWNLTNVTFSELEWIKANLPLAKADQDQLKIIPSQAIWRIDLDQKQQVLSQQLFSQGWVVNYDVVNQVLVFTNPVVKYENNQWTSQILTNPTKTISLKVVNRPQFISQDQIIYRLKTIINGSLIKVPLSASGFSYFLQQNPDTDFFNWFEEFDFVWINALKNYQFANQPKPTLKLLNITSVSDVYNNAHLEMQIIHPQFLDHLPSGITLNFFNAIDAQQFSFAINFKQNDPFSQSFLKQWLQDQPQLVLQINQWFNNEFIEKWTETAVVANPTYFQTLNGWFNQPFDQNLVKQILQVAPESRFFINRDYPNIKTALINDPNDQLLSFPKYPQYNFANQILSLENQNQSVVDKLSFEQPISHVDGVVKQLSPFDKNLVISFRMNANWKLIGQYSNDQQSSDLNINIVLNQPLT